MFSTSNELGILLPTFWCHFPFGFRQTELKLRGQLVSFRGQLVSFGIIFFAPLTFTLISHSFFCLKNCSRHTWLVRNGASVMDLTVFGLCGVCTRPESISSQGLAYSIPKCLPRYHWSHTRLFNQRSKHWVQNWHQEERFKAAYSVCLFCTWKGTYWVLDSITDVKFVGLNPLPYDNSDKLIRLKAKDRCPQLDEDSMAKITTSYLYKAKVPSAAIYLSG